MQIEKIVLEKSARIVLEKAEDCFVLAKCEQSLADQGGEIAAKQHENADLHRELAVEQNGNADKLEAHADKLEAHADKLDAMGHALEAKAIEIMGDTAVVQRGRP